MRFVHWHFSASAIYSLHLCGDVSLSCITLSLVRTTSLYFFYRGTSYYHTTFRYTIRKRKENRKQKTFAQGKNVLKEYTTKEC